MPSNTVWVEIEIKHATNKAIMVENVVGKDEWIPISAIIDQSEDCALDPGVSMEIELSEYMAMQKGMI